MVVNEEIPLQGKQLAEFVVHKIEDMKGRDVVVLDVSAQSSITDTMVICSGNSKRHVQSIADNVASEARSAGLKPFAVEGKETGEWVLVDLGDCILHVMQESSREFYQLEKLWA